VFTSNAFDTAVPVERIDGVQLRELYPYLAFAPGASGLRQPEGLIINPRRFVAAQQALFTAAGGERIRDRAVSLSEDTSGVIVETASRGHIQARKVVVAAGAYINLDRLLPRQLEFTILGLTVPLARVAEDTKRFPTLMYSDVVSDVPFSGLIVPPIRYPDGHVYIKSAGGVSIDVLKDDRDEVESWLHAGGDQDGARAFQPVLEQLVPGLVVEDIVARPCLVTMNHATTPYIGHVSDRTVVATEGDHGVTIGDEIGRLAANLTRSGEWTDSLPEALFTPRFV
jgi:sarcosine oxidase